MPAYGFGSILLRYAPRYIQGFAGRIIPEAYAEHPAMLIFTLCFIILFFELLTDIGMEAAFGVKWRDFSQKKCNLAGRVHIPRTVCRVLAGAILIQYVHPAMIEWIGYAPYRWRLYVAGMFILLFIVDAAASTLHALYLGKTMSDLETMVVIQHMGLRAKQEEYEQKFRDYTVKKALQQQGWRKSVTDARAGLPGGPQAGARAGLPGDPQAGAMEVDRRIELANEELRSTLRSMKEEIAEAADRRDDARQALQEYIRQAIGEAAVKIRRARRYRGICRLFRAFPDMGSAKEPAILSEKRIKTANIAMLTPDLSAIRYLWLEAKMLIGNNSTKSIGGVRVKYVCSACGFAYDPEAGDPDNNIAPGTAFEALPDDWACPLCGVGKDGFEAKE